MFLQPFSPDIVLESVKSIRTSDERTIALAN